MALPQFTLYVYLYLLSKLCHKKASWVNKYKKDKIDEFRTKSGIDILKSEKPHVHFE